jgi:hypothetical protein
MNGRTRGIAGLLGTAALAGCLSSVPEGQINRPSRPPARLGSAIVIDGEQLWARGGALLDGLIGRAGNLLVDRGGASRCPSLTLRGPKTLIGTSNPRVYVDGTLFDDTCILDQIRARDVERVEVYPGGSTHRPGYRPSPFGLVLVFLTGGESSR